MLCHALRTDDPAFVSMYDEIIESYLRAGIKIYGLIGAEAVASGETLAFTIGPALCLMQASLYHHVVLRLQS